MSCGPSEAVVTIDRFGPVNGCQRETIRSSDRLLTCGSISNAFWPSGPCDGMRLRHSGWADSQQDVHGYLPGAILGGESVPRAVMMLITAKLPRKRPNRSYSKVPLALPSGGVPGPLAYHLDALTQQKIMQGMQAVPFI